MTSKSQRDADPSLCMEWPRESFERRVENCRVMLHLHGLISESENEKVKRRIRKCIESRAEKPQPRKRKQGQDEVASL